MSEIAAIADAVLITLHPVADGVDAPVVLGRSVPERQVEFAATLGCRKVFLLDGGGSHESIAARHVAEEAGMKVQEISTAHALVHSVRGGEKLLVLQSDLLPGWIDWPGEGAETGEVLVLPADVGVNAGFERIDLSRAWSGALIVPQSLLGRLLDLPEDMEAAPALLRIALQARVPDLALPEARLSDGSWSLLGPDDDGDAVESAWIASRFQPAPGDSISRRLAMRCLRMFGAKFASGRGALAGAVALMLALLAGGAAAAFYGYGAAGFAIIALGSLAAEFAIGIRDLQAKPGEGPAHWPKLRWAVDLAILACGIFALEGTWFRRAFPPLLMLAAYHNAWRRIWLDRTIICLLVAAMGAVAPLDAAISLMTLLSLGLGLLPRPKQRS